MFDEWWGGQWVVGDTLLLAVLGVHQAADIVVRYGSVSSGWLPSGIKSTSGAKALGGKKST